MVLDDFENMLTLLATVIGLLYCLFKYIKNPRRGYIILIVFYMSNFLSDYYWTIYSLVMRYYPEVSEFLAYLGWNIAYLVLLFAVFYMTADRARRFFHPVILWPIFTNVSQFMIYIQYGGLFNNLWQVGVTTLTMILCMQGIVYYRKNKKNGAKKPYFSILVLAYLIVEYAMWTSSCFEWSSQFLDPYFYCTLLNAILSITLVWGAEKFYGVGSTKTSLNGLAESRYQILFQAIVTVLICGASVGGYILATVLKDSIPELQIGTLATDRIVVMLFGISVILVLLILLLVYEINRHYKKVRENNQEMDVKKRNRFSFIFTIAITFALMLFDVVYNTMLLYDVSVTEIYEDAKDVVNSTAAELENYLTVAETTLRVVADSVELMSQNGASSDEIYQYLTVQTTLQAEQFDENFTGIYAYIDGTFMDGSGWVPPEGYDPVERDWYKTAIKGSGEITIVSPYVDAQTGDVVVTFVKSLINGNKEDAANAHNVVALDVIVNHVQEVTEQVNIAGKGYGMVANTDGFIVAHNDRSWNGKKLSDIFENKVIGFDEGRFDTKIDGKDCTVFARSIMGQWTVLIVVSNDELLEGVHSQLAVNILVSFVIFLMITFFYYFGYKIEQHNYRKIEEMNMEVVSALAEAIDAKDTYTNGHSSRVAKYSKMIALRAGYSESDQNEVYMMGLLHDVGKIGVPDEVINKTARLTDEEYEIIKTHPVIGSKILGSIKENPRLAIGARWHHERYDGTGYPDKLSGKDIPEEARIIAVADAYDAMTSRRSYRSVMPQEKVRSEIEKGTGTQFDPAFAKIMISIIDEDRHYTMREQ